MLCKKCSANIPDGGLFCPICGSRVDGKKPCPKCDKLVPEESVFCSYCGTSFGGTENTSPLKNKEGTTEGGEQIDMVKAIICTQCGSTDIDLISEDFGKCRNCGTQVVINIQKERGIVNNNVNIQMVNKPKEAPLGFLELPIEVDTQSFFVDVLTKIAQTNTTPDDIFLNGEFEPIKTKYYQYLIGAGNVNMMYSATVGYDRGEEYYEQVREYDRTIRDYRYVDKKRFRTVTDWTPFNGNYVGEHYGAAVNEEAEGSDVYDYFYNCFKKAKIYDSKNSNAPVPLSPTENAVKEVKTHIQSNAKEACKNSLPGDRYKNFSSTGTVEVTKLECHVAPRYELNFKYKGQQYSASAHTVKNSNKKENFPSATVVNENEIEQRKVVKIFNILTFISLIVSVLSIIILPLIFKIVFACMGVVMYITNCVVRTIVSKKIYKEKELFKKKTLIELLNKKGIEIPKTLKEDFKI